MSRYDRQLRRGAIVNAFGLVAKLLEPLLILVITWMFGPAVVAIYLLALFLAEMVSGMLANGWADATTVFASHDADEGTANAEARERLYNALANGFLWSIGASVAVALLVQLLGGPFVHAVFPEHPGLAPGLPLVGWSLVPMAVTQVAVAATKAHLRMEYDALLSAVRPLTMLAGAAVALALGAGATGVLAAHLASWCVGAVFAIAALARHYELGALLRALRRFSPHRRMLDFAVPQALNLTFNRYITRLDVLMLAAMGFGSLEVAWYGTASLLTSNLKQIRLIFSGALAPVAARHHRAGEKEQLSGVLSRLSNLAMRIAVPAVLLAVVLRDDILQLADEAYVGDSLFIAVLLIPPLGSCAYGMAGNSLIYTGHTRWTLANSLSVAAINTVLNLIMIPLWGLLGAAIATSIAISIVTALQLVELRALEGVVIQWRQVQATHLGLGVSLAALVLLWDPAALPGLPLRLAASAGLVVLFLVVARVADAVVGQKAAAGA